VNMNFDRFIERAQEAVFDAQQAALEFRHAAIEPAHILRALVRQDQNVASQIFARVHRGRMVYLEPIMTVWTLGGNNCATIRFQS
jgi:hypothetical protein